MLNSQSRLTINIDYVDRFYNKIGWWRVEGSCLQSELTVGCKATRRQGDKATRRYLAQGHARTKAVSVDQ